jgi:hypothetical protein
MLRKLAKIALVNLAVFAALAVVVELFFGNWLRPLDVDDLKRFSIPVDMRQEFDVAGLYPGGTTAVYHRDRYGLRGEYRDLAEIDVLTVGGSTTDQRFLDEAATWQAVAARRLAELGTRATVVNAGVDGQSMTGHKFDFDNWFPLLPGLRPRVVLFYVGINDVLKRPDRGEYDGALDASSWRVKSALWQFARVVRGNLRARSANVVHGAKPQLDESAFTDQGLLAAPQREALAAEIQARFTRDAAELASRARAIGARPVFVTQSAFAWNAGAGPVRGLRDELHVHGTTMNYADVSFLHQRMNAALLDWCRRTAVECFDAASEVELARSDYYDFVHTDPRGAARIGHYVAERLAPLLASSAGQVTTQ